jgi:hypothetical protein
MALSEIRLPDLPGLPGGLFADRHPANGVAEVRGQGHNELEHGVDRFGAEVRPRSIDAMPKEYGLIVAADRMRVKDDEVVEAGNQVGRFGPRP